jgi:DNA-binding SARP family transcriptional activator
MYIGGANASNYERDVETSNGAGTIEFRILGQLEIAIGGCAVPLGGRKQRGLLAILMLSANEVVSSDRLIDELWGDTSPASGRAALQVRVSQLRKALGEAGGQLLTRGAGYVLRVEPDQLDLHRFERLVRETEGASPEAAAIELREALGLWRGELLADLCYEPFVQSPSLRLQELRMVALERRIEADLSLGRRSELISELGVLIHEHPLREQLYRQLMLALYRSGRQAEALDVFRRARAQLNDELGLEPGPELAGLQRAILTHDRSLEPEHLARGDVGNPRSLQQISSDARDRRTVTTPPATLASGLARTRTTRLALRRRAESRRCICS